MKLIFFIFFISNILFSNDIYIDNIFIEGNKNIKSNEIHKNMKLKRPSFFIRTVFSKKLLNQDVQNILGLYKTRGYINAHITTSIENQKNNYVNITYNIKEGEKYVFNELIIKGNNYFANKTISSFFIDQIPKEFNQILIKKTILDLKKEYLKLGR